MSIDLEPPYTRPIQIGSTTIGGALPFVLIAGPRRIHSAERAISLADKIDAHAREFDVPFLFSTTSETSEDSTGESLETLREIRARVGCPVSTHVFDVREIEAIAEVVDFLQIPGSLSRKSELVLGAARTGKPVNIRKDMSLSPVEAIRIVEDVAAVGNWNVILTEMGTSLDGTLLVDFHGFAALKESGFPVVFDASSPRLGFSPALSAAGLAAGADGLLLTVTEDESSVQDPGACPMEHVPELLRRWKGIDVLLKKLR